MGGGGGRCVRCSSRAAYADGLCRGKRDLATHCERHRGSGQVLCGAPKTCEWDGCRKARIFGPPGGVATHCAAHRAPGWSDLKNPRCRAEGCSRQPSFGSPDTGMRTACARHRRAADVDLKNIAKRCKVRAPCARGVGA